MCDSNPHCNKIVATNFAQGIYQKNVAVRFTVIKLQQRQYFLEFEVSENRG